MKKFPLVIFLFSVLIFMLACSGGVSAVPVTQGPVSVLTPAYLLEYPDGSQTNAIVYISKGDTTCVTVVTDQGNPAKSCFDLVLEEKQFDVPSNQALFPSSINMKDGKYVSSEYTFNVSKSYDCYVTSDGISSTIDCIRNY